MLKLRLEDAPNRSEVGEIRVYGCKSRSVVTAYHNHNPHTKSDINILGRDEFGVFLVVPNVGKLNKQLEVLELGRTAGMFLGTMLTL